MTVHVSPDKVISSQLRLIKLKEKLLVPSAGSAQHWASERRRLSRGHPATPGEHLVLE